MRRREAEVLAAAGRKADLMQRKASELAQLIGGV